MDLPTGTVTFLFTDIEGSTRLLQALGEAYRAVEDAHARIMRAAIAEGGGVVIKTEGDSFFAVFEDHARAVRAVVGAQRALAAHPWTHGEPLRVRMGLHTGRAERVGRDYLGIEVNRAARIAAAGHGGQILLSDATRALIRDDLPAGVGLRDLGRHRLKDFDEPVRIHDLVIDGLPWQFPPIRTLEVPSNLPVPLTSFVGREREVGRVAALLEEGRLVTLTGPGGTGKTRLAIEVAGRSTPAFPDGTFFVDLSTITDPRLVPDTIASALRFLPERSGRSVIEILEEHLRERTALLLMDNFEQVLAAADTLAVLLAAASRLRALATSRAPLRLSGERAFPVPPLETVDPADDAERLRHSDPVKLFVDRAAAVDPDFDLEDADVSVVAEICARLDGLPLAIELAASRVRLFPPHTLLERLEPALPMLVGGPRDAPERQRTLEAAIEWSHALLEERERILFRRLAVFAGGWTADTAAEVADPRGDPGNGLGVMESLVDHSLVRRVPSDPEGRLRMLETIREYGLARLEESGEAEEVRRRHADRFLTLAEAARPRLTAPDQREWLERLSREHENLRAALGWAIDRDDGERVLRIAAPLWRFWYARGHLEEGRRWLEGALRLPSSRQPTTHRARALSALGGITYWQSDFDASLAAYEEALSIHRADVDRASMVESLLELGEVRAVNGDPSALGLIEESLALARELGDRRGEGWALWGLGTVRVFAGDLEGARDLLEQSLNIFRAVGDDTWGWGNALAGLGSVAARRGELVDAGRHIFAAFDMWGEQANALIVAGNLPLLAMVANELGHYQRGARLSGAGAAWRDKVGGKIPDAFFPAGDPAEVAARNLAPADFERAWAEGQAMSLEEALAYAREEA